MNQQQASAREGVPGENEEGMEEVRNKVKWKYK